MAIRFLRAFSDQLNIDPERIATLGHSAGGHLAVLAGTNYPFAKTDYSEYCDEVSCAIGMYAPLDLAAIIEDRKNDNPHERRPRPAVSYKQARILKPFEPMERAEGMSAESRLINNDLSLCSTASPVNTVNDRTAPILLINGDTDTTVKLFNVENMKKAMDKAGKTCECYIVKGAAHSDPLFSQDEILDLIADFLKRYL